MGVETGDIEQNVKTKEKRTKYLLFDAPDSERSKMSRLTELKVRLWMYGGRINSRRKDRWSNEVL